MTSRRGLRKGLPPSLVRGLAERSCFAGRSRSMLFPDVLINSRLETTHQLYRRDLYAHFGCVNAIEFSAGDGRLIASGTVLVNSGLARNLLMGRHTESLEGGTPEAEPRWGSGGEVPRDLCR